MHALAERAGIGQVTVEVADPARPRRRRRFGRSRSDPGDPVVVVTDGARGVRLNVRTVVAGTSSEFDRGSAVRAMWRAPGGKTEEAKPGRLLLASSTVIVGCRFEPELVVGDPRIDLIASLAAGGVLFDGDTFWDGAGNALVRGVS